MKKWIVMIFAAAVFLRFPLVVAAQETAAQDAYFSGAFSAIDEETAALLRGIGIDPSDLYSLTSLSPESLLSVLRELFGAGVAAQAKLFGACVELMLLLRFFGSFLPSDTLRDAAEQVGGMSVVFLLISGAAAVGDGCVRAVRLTKTCMLALIPVLGAVTAFSGNPVSAVGVQGVVFTFAEGVGVLFADLIVPLTAVGAALGSAAAISPVPGPEQLAVLLNKFVAWGMGLVSGVFCAVLGLRGAVSGAADGVAFKGLKFLVGGVPLVGSAVGDALSSVGASLAVVKNSVAVLGVLAVAFISLPPFCTALIWKVLLHLLGAAAQMCGLKKLSPFLSVLASTFNVLIAMLAFNACVYVIALAAVVAVKAG